MKTGFFWSIDIPRLAEHFAQAAARRLRRPTPRLGEAALRRLTARDWPGNIRELENVIERAVILARDCELRFDAPPAPSLRPRATPSSLPQLSRQALETHQRETIAAALERTAGRVSGAGGAAELLGMKASTLFSRMSVLGLRRGQSPGGDVVPSASEALA